MTERPSYRRARSITSLVRRQESSGPTVLSILVSAYQVRWRNVEERLATHPNEAAQLDSSGCSVLYRALIRRSNDYPPYPIVRAILRAYPKAIWERQHKMTLLEIAARRMASLETLELLCQARPAIPEDTLSVPALWQVYSNHYGSEGCLIRLLQSGCPEAFELGCKFQILIRYLTTEYLAPCTLHTAAASLYCSLHLFKSFCQVFPNDLFEIKTFEGRSPLHLALGATAMMKSCEQKQNQISKANYLTEFYSISADQYALRGRRRTQSAHGKHADESVDVLMQADPMASRTFARLDPETSLYPFQMAAASDAPLSTIYSLLRSCPNIIEGRNAIETASSYDAIPSDLVIEANPEWITPRLEKIFDAVEPTKWAELQKTLRTPVDPLWHQLIGAARVFGCPLPLLRMLIDMHPEKLLHADKRGWLPLHHAVIAPQGDQREAIRMILEACPEAAHHRDNNGLLPLHLAVLSGKGIWLLQILLQYNPSVLHQPDSLLGLPPPLLAAQWPRSSLSTVFYLISLTPELIVNTARMMKKKKKHPWNTQLSACNQVQ